MYVCMYYLMKEFGDLWVDLKALEELVTCSVGCELVQDVVEGSAFRVAASGLLVEDTSYLYLHWLLSLHLNDHSQPSSILPPDSSSTPVP